MSTTRVTVAACAFGLTAALAFTAVPTATAIPAAPHGPKNVIVLIGDGMGYKQQAAASLYAKGVSYKQAAGAPGSVKELQGSPAFNFQRFPLQVDMSTYAIDGSYDPAQAWSDFDYIKNNPTDSSAAGTAMSTGVKTYNGALGVDVNKQPIENISERALSMGKAAGSISTVNYWHATPASYVVHNPNRNDKLNITHEEINSDMTVIMGAGHPYYTDDNTLREPNWKGNISEADFTALAGGVHGWDLVESKADFESLTTGETPDRVFGIAQVNSTLQQSRSGESKVPFDVPFNANVPDLATMTAGALNVLDNDPDGFSLMVEGGAIDWAGHGNQGARNIEETLDFNEAIDTVIDWVETNSSWKETLVIVTADHETGYLEGAGADPEWMALTGTAGAMPSHGWFSTDHTNQLIPVFAKGAGAKELGRYATMTDPVRGRYLDNTALGKVLLEDLWAEGPGASAGNGKGHAKQADKKAAQAEKKAAKKAAQAAKKAAK